MLLLLSTLALAAPDIDTPVRTQEKAPNDAAVVVGIEDYFAIADVPYAERDAQAFHDFLRYTRGVPADRIHLLGKGTSRELLLGALEEAAEEADSGGVLWVYYAGHGAASAVDSQRVLLGADAMPDARVFESRAVKLSEIEQLAGRTQADRTLILLDTCYGGVGRAGEELLPGTRFAVPSYVTKPTTKVAVWTAASKNELSGPYEPARHGAFTYFVLGGLRGWADGELGDADGKVTLDEAQAFVERSLRTVGTRSQRPELRGENVRDWVLSKASEKAPELSNDALAAADVEVGPKSKYAPGPAGWTEERELGSSPNLAWSQSFVYDRRTQLIWDRAPKKSKNQEHAQHDACTFDLETGEVWHLPEIKQLQALHDGAERWELLEAFGSEEYVTVANVGWSDAASVRGYTIVTGKTDTWRSGAVNCVKGDLEPVQVDKESTTHFFEREENRAIDGRTGLIWTRKALANVKGGKAAMAMCKTVVVDGWTGWRMPSRQELEGILEPGRPALNTSVFEFSGGTWADQPIAGATKAAVVDFGDGEKGTEDFWRKNDVVCVGDADVLVRELPRGRFDPAPDWTTQTVLGEGRFVYTEDVAFDTNTGLTWAAEPIESEGWHDAHDLHCPDLAVDGGGWRLPTVEQVLSLRYPSGSTPPWDQSVFPDVKYKVFAVSEEGGSGSAGLDPKRKYRPYHALCVRGGDGSPPVRPPKTDDQFKLQDDVARDKRTKITWTRHIVAESVKYEQAVEACAALGKFRLPTHEELSTLLEFGHGSPLLNTNVFVDTETAEDLAFWTTTLTRQNTDNLKVVDFQFGIDRSYSPKTRVEVLCVAK